MFFVDVKLLFFCNAFLSLGFLSNIITIVLFTHLHRMLTNTHTHATMVALSCSHRHPHHHHHCNCADVSFACSSSILLTGFTNKLWKIYCFINIIHITILNTFILIFTKLDFKITKYHFYARILAFSSSEENFFSFEPNKQPNSWKFEQNSFVRSKML